MEQVFWLDALPVNSTFNIKALKETQSIDPKQWPHLDISSSISDSQKALLVPLCQLSKHSFSAIRYMKGQKYMLD